MCVSESLIPGPHEAPTTVAGAPAACDAMDSLMDIPVVSSGFAIDGVSWARFVGWAAAAQ